MAQNSVIAGSYDFGLLEVGCARLEYNDFSKWSTGGQFSPPTFYNVEVTTPAGAQHVLRVAANGPTAIRPEDLGYKECIPSGVYTFRAVRGQGVGGIDYYKRVGIFCEQNCGLQKAIGKLKPSEDPEKVIKIRDYLLRARNAAELGDFTTAIRYADIVDDELARINCSCKCS